MTAQDVGLGCGATGSPHVLRRLASLLGSPAVQPFCGTGENLRGHRNTPFRRCFLPLFRSHTTRPVRGALAALFGSHIRIASPSNSTPLFRRPRSLGSLRDLAAFFVGQPRGCSDYFIALIQRHSGDTLTRRYRSASRCSPTRPAARDGIPQARTVMPMKHDPTLFSFFKAPAAGFDHFNRRVQPDAQKVNNPALLGRVLRSEGVIDMFPQARFDAPVGNADVACLSGSRVSQKVDDPIHAQSGCAKSPMFTRFKSVVPTAMGCGI